MRTHTHWHTMSPIFLILPHVDHVIRACPRTLPMLLAFHKIAFVLPLCLQNQLPLSMRQPVLILEHTDLLISDAWGSKTSMNEEIKNNQLKKRAGRRKYLALVSTRLLLPHKYAFTMHAIILPIPIIRVPVLPCAAPLQASHRIVDVK